MIAAAEQCSFPDLCVPHWERLVSMTQPLELVFAHKLEAVPPFDVSGRPGQGPARFSRAELGSLTQWQSDAWLSSPSCMEAGREYSCQQICSHLSQGGSIHWGSTTNNTKLYHWPAPPPTRTIIPGAIHTWGSEPVLCSHFLIKPVQIFAFLYLKNHL